MGVDLAQRHEAGRGRNGHWMVPVGSFSPCVNRASAANCSQRALTVTSPARSLDRHFVAALLDAGDGGIADLPRGARQRASEGIRELNRARFAFEEPGLRRYVATDDTGPCRET